ncbi:MAG: imidazole glycerol phosphate synthase subunit HisH [Deltaproteobacteria bacterium]|nr:imidazole glycerol phosphate synthase subunit HisH [Deltaproteobacteria bacterium]
MKVLVVPTGVANLASIRAGFLRAGAEVEVTHDADLVRRAPAVVLPGVGAFGAGRAALDGLGLVDALRERIAADRPLFAVCLGMQLLAVGSDETPEARGLGVLDAHVGRFPDTVKVPQLGWNRVVAHPGSRYVTNGYAYFANSYRIADEPAGFAASMADHGGPFCAALERGALLACQFHPELSGAWGLDLMRRWLGAAMGATAGATTEAG